MLINVTYCVKGHIISSHIDCRPLNQIKTKSYRRRLCDIRKNWIVIQRINIISYHDKTGDLHPYTLPMLCLTGRHPGWLLTLPTASLSKVKIMLSSVNGGVSFSDWTITKEQNRQLTQAKRGVCSWPNAWCLKCALLWEGGTFEHGCSYEFSLSLFLDQDNTTTHDPLSGYYHNEWTIGTCVNASQFTLNPLCVFLDCLVQSWRDRPGVSPAWCIEFWKVLYATFRPRFEHTLWL